MNKLYNDINTYWKNRFGTKVYKIALDAGFTCPNRDGTKGKGGCIYCDENGSRAPYANIKQTIKEQIIQRIQYLKKTYAAKKFAAYFQSFSNTYGTTKECKEVYDQVLGIPDIVVLSISTRPDCINLRKLNLIKKYSENYETWLEYGLQSIKNETLKWLNRAHTVEAFAKAVKLTKNKNLMVCAHIIVGLPNQDKKEIIDTAAFLSDLGVDGVKIHVLHVLKKSRLYDLYIKNEIKMIDETKYAELVCLFLEHLSPSVTIHRLTGQGTDTNHVAPLWALNKTETINKIQKLLLQRQTRQGNRYKQNE